MAKRKLTPIQQQYRKERRRIQNAMNRLDKQGYVLPEDLLPSIPKKVTQASINRLKKITSESIYKKSKKLDFETGEAIPGIVARDKARSQRAKEAARRRSFKQEYVSPQFYTEPPQYTTFPSGADIIISNFRSDVIGRFPESAGPILNRWLDGLLAQQDKEDVANMLETAAANGVVIDYKVAYNTEALMGAIADFMDYLDTTSGFKQDLMDTLEFEEDWEFPD
ncbi:hypothetical protein CS229P3_00012 [Clostridium phage CS229P3]|nr:hypothetical protein CS229P1_00013 [Clostridium phage CS229P1]WAX12025.1 hypothetical protein CS229P2_00012 [Clostridium phage CS229P2]WAX12049.1 hypothetical protein CS229P3_00012 [Clostridium phage CS229P3]